MTAATKDKSMTGDRKATLIEELREFSIPGVEDYPDWHPGICIEAANEIERLSGLNAELLAALQVALLMLEEGAKLGDPEWDGTVEPNSAIGLARSAIAKADSK